MENAENLYDVTVATGDPQYVVNMVILRYGISKNDFLDVLQKNGIMPMGLVFDKPNLSQFVDMTNKYRIEVYPH